MLVGGEGLYSFPHYLFVSQQEGNPLHTLYSLTFAPAEIWAIEVRLNCISRHSADTRDQSAISLLLLYIISHHPLVQAMQGKAPHISPLPVMAG